MLTETALDTLFYRCHPTSLNTRQAASEHCHRSSGHNAGPSEVREQNKGSELSHCHGNVSRKRHDPAYEATHMRCKQSPLQLFRQKSVFSEPAPIDAPFEQEIAAEIKSRGEVCLGGFSGGNEVGCRK